MLDLKYGAIEETGKTWWGINKAELNGPSWEAGCTAEKAFSLVTIHLALARGGTTRRPLQMILMTMQAQVGIFVNTAAAKLMTTRAPASIR